MVIIQGKDKFSIVDISSKELSHVYDAFASGRHNFLELLKGKDKELTKALSVKPEEMAEVRKSLEEKIEFYFKHQQKIQKYAQKG